MSDSLISSAQPDGFTHESPIRAFTDFKVAGTWAIGKGFRPSLGHLHTYLAAMERKEGWHMVQMLDGGTLDPTLIFQRRSEAPDAHSAMARFMKRRHEDGKGPDDPVSPKHYNGTACAEIGELLTANSFQVLRYNWRLGKKDEAVQEIDKSLWYLDREIELTPALTPRRIPDHAWFDERLRHADDHARAVGRVLVSWNRYGKVESLKALRRVLVTKKGEYRDLPEGLAC